MSATWRERLIAPTYEDVRLSGRWDTCAVNEHHPTIAKFFQHTEDQDGPIDPTYLLNKDLRDLYSWGRIFARCLNNHDLAAARRFHDLIKDWKPTSHATRRGVHVYTFLDYTWRGHAARVKRLGQTKAYVRITRRTRRPVTINGRGTFTTRHISKTRWVRVTDLRPKQ